MHIDNAYVTERGAGHKRERLRLLVRLYDNFMRQMKAFPKPYQLWIDIDLQTDRNNAVYVHTENPNTNSPFPLSWHQVEWGVFVPNRLQPHYDNAAMAIGRYIGSESRYIVVSKDELR